MKVGIATDHNGVVQKKELIDYLVSLGYEVMDLSEENTPIDDYPDFATVVAEKVLTSKIEQGILMCGTGIGMSIAANKFKGIRCAKVSNVDEAILAREHNDANIIALNYTMPMDELKSILLTFLKTDFSGIKGQIKKIKK